MMKPSLDPDLTFDDILALRKIAVCGFVGVDTDGEPWLASGRDIGRERVERLCQHGLIVSNHDSLLPEIAGPQSYSISYLGRQVLQCVKREKPGCLGSLKR